MLKKWFLRAFLEIEKISQNLGVNMGRKLWKIEFLMKTCIASAKPHTMVFRFFARYYDAKQLIHKRITWNWENILKSGPKIEPKIMKYWILMKRCIGSAKTHRSVFRFFAIYYDAEEVIHKRISWNWEYISTSGPKFGPKWWKNESLMKRCIRSGKPHRNVFRFFARYYDAEEVIHKRISWNWENISKSGPKFGPKIMKNWKFDEKVHRIRKTLQSSVLLFRKIILCWRSDS